MNPIIYQAVTAYIVGRADRYQTHGDLARDALDFGEAMWAEVQRRYPVPKPGVGDSQGSDGVTD